jgi:hypothetical protein
MYRPECKNEERTHQFNRSLKVPVKHAAVTKLPFKEIIFVKKRLQGFFLIGKFFRSTLCRSIFMYVQEVKSKGDAMKRNLLSSPSVIRTVPAVSLTLLPGLG